MCGIAGLVALDGALPPGAGKMVRSMTDAMKYRGPDGSGIRDFGAACLGHRRLSIIDLAGGSQPMCDFSGQYWIIFNGEIYNFRELREELTRAGARFRTNSDTEVILAAYAGWGKACLERLEGMFAFALWDGKRKSLFCARDHFGKKPFYYTMQQNILAFSSELDPLLVLRGWGERPLSFSIDPASVIRYLAYEYIPTPSTPYQEAHILPPAHYMFCEHGEVVIDRYWSLPAPADNLPAPVPELEEELRSLMRKAVAKRMISDVPLGVFLSGGIDSTIVAGLMAELSDKPIQTFSIGFREASYDESRYAKIAAHAYHAIQHERILSADECADQLPGITARMDTPMADASCAPTWLLAALAREHVVVALGGDGADELWAGYEHYIGYKLALAYNHLPEFVRTFLRFVTRFLPGSAGYINPRLAVRTFLEGAASPDWLRVQAMLTAMPAAMQKNVLSPAWLAEAGPQTLCDDILYASTREQFDYWQDKTGPLARAFHVYCRQFLLDDILVKVDRCSMLHSLEVRAPFLDKLVAEFAARLPIPCKLHGFKRKYLLKKAFARLLPSQIAGRNKRGFQIPVAAWLRGRLRPLLLEMASPAFLKSQGIFDADNISRLMEAHFSEQQDLRKPLWTFLVFQLWWQAHKGRFIAPW